MNRSSLPCILLIAASATEALADPPTGGPERLKSVDGVTSVVADNTRTSGHVAKIDHARLAAEEGVAMPASILTIFSEPETNTPLMRLDPRVGLDLPGKVLAYEEDGKVTVAYAGAEFLAARHGLEPGPALEQYGRLAKGVLHGIPEAMHSPVSAVGVAENFGIVELDSGFGFDESVRRLKEAVLAQGDTVWFGEVDFRADAAVQGESIPPATLLLFGGPKPGGVAMAEFPKLGLDAFCQKLLVYENAAGGVTVIFNDIVELAKLHYGKSERPHEVINGRLTETFRNAVAGE